MHKNKKDTRDIDIVVCIATYKRHKGLCNALEALAGQSTDKKFTVIIANNDPEDQTIPSLVAPFKEKLSIEVITVYEKGVAIVRNRLVSTACTRFPEAKWIAFQDDDERASEDWLLELVRLGEHYSADLVGGFSDILCSTGSEDRVKRLDIPNEGPIKILNGTGNLLISIPFLNKIKREPFDPAYGLSGGEDYEFFCYAQKNNALMVWSNAAKIYEDWPEERFKARGVLEREYRKGIYMAKVDVKYMGRIFSFLKTVKGFIYIPIYLFKDFTSKKGFSLSVFLSVKRFYYFCGRIIGHLGGVTTYYGGFNES